MDGPLLKYVDIIRERERESVHASDAHEPTRLCACVHTQVMGKVAAVQGQEEVTLPFYFICLLHLANEKGLELQGQDDLSDFCIASKGIISS